MRDEFSHGWCEAYISDFADVFLGKTPAKADYTSSGHLKVIKFRDLQDGRLDFFNARYGFIREHGGAISGLRELNKDDVLITSAAHSGENIGKKCAYVSNLPEQFSQVFFTGELLNIRCPDKVLSRWVYLFFRSAEGFSEIQEAVKGVHLTGGRAKQMRLPIAPLAEQQRIIVKLDKLLDEVEGSQKRLAKIQVLLKRFRQSVLAAACTGRLTADWREKNPSVKIENKLMNHKQNGRVISDTIDSYYEFDLPSTWAWLRVNDIGDVKGGKRLPKGAKFVKENTGLPYIKAGCLKEGTVLREKLAYLTPDIQSKIKRYIVNAGDVYITNVGACIGDAGIIPVDLEGANLTENAVKICNLNGVYNQYLANWLRSPGCQDFIRLTVLSAAQGKLALGRVKMLPIPLPPLLEQKEIVRRVDDLFALVDKIEARYQKAQVHVNKLTQSILAKAFRGELVPQDPNDEPASKLLERISKVK